MLVAPVSRLRILFGNALGGATISMSQGVIIFVISLIFGFRPYSWLLVIPAFLVMLLMTLALTCFGAGMASAVDDFQGFQGINNLVVLPLFFLSSALYPLNNIPLALKIISTLNPVSYMVDALRFLLANQTHFGLGKDLIVITVTFILCMLFAVNRFNRIQM